MQKNDIISLEIVDMGANGEGIGKYEGMTFFVKDALIGDAIRARITKIKKSYGYARLEELVVPSRFRVEPKCELHKRCGGCQIQALDYDRQLVYKQDKIRGNLIRIGGFSPEFADSVMQPIVGMKRPYRYRNKAQFPIGRTKEGKLTAGFYAAHSHSIIPVADCKLGVRENKDILDAVLSYMEENDILHYDEESGTGLVRHVLIRYGFATKELMVCIVINGTNLPKQEKLIERLRGLDGMTSISINRNLNKTNVILGDETVTIWGQPYITDYIHLRKCGEERPGWKTEEEFLPTGDAIAYHISPQSFYQVNPEQTEKLYSLALSYAGLTGNETVWDLYCGIGTISLFLARKARKVYGVEIVPQAIADARVNAELNGISNVEFFVGKAEEVLPEFYEKEATRSADEGDSRMAHPDVIVVDPPRKGCDEKCLETMLLMRPERIVYVSCDSATLARDLKVLCDGGYEVKRVRGVDQFGQTVHVETVCLLSKLNAKQHIEVDIHMDELDLTDAEKKATYSEIKEYVLEHTGLKVSSLYIAQVKQKCGIIERENYNKPKSEDARQPQCSLDKEKAIINALRHFGMI